MNPYLHYFSLYTRPALTTLSEASRYASKKTGLAPGTLIHVGEIHAHAQRISVIHYNDSFLEKHDIQSINELNLDNTLPYLTWVRIDSLKDTAIINAIGERFAIHHLVLEDILNTHQRPKFEEFSDYLYIVIKAMRVEKTDFTIAYEQISLLVLPTLVFSFSEQPTPLFDNIIERLDNDKSQLRLSGIDYLTYSIMDTIIDEYFILQDTLDELLEDVEEELLAQPCEKTLASIQKIKRELIFLRRTLAPVRELLAKLQRSDSALLTERTRRYFSDVYDHAIRIIETMDAYRDLITGMLDIYLSSVSNKLNETMKVLTIFTSIFTPLTFIAGVYGMNFHYMPELSWQWGYAMAWGIFGTVTSVLLYFFKKKKWL